MGFQENPIRQHDPMDSNKMVPMDTVIWELVSDKDVSPYRTSFTEIFTSHECPLCENPISKDIIEKKVFR